MALTKVSYSMIQGSEVNVFDYMSAAQIADISSGTGAVRCDVEIQTCIDAIQAMNFRPTIVFPVGEYRLEAGLTITAQGMSFFGLGMPLITSATTEGAVLRYYGVGTALTIGVNPGVNGTFIYETNIQNIGIEVDNDTSCAMRVWHSIAGYFKNIAIFGNKGSGIGLLVNAGVNNIYEQIIISGQGQTAGANTSEYAAAGMRLRLGYLNDLATTTIFRRCYISACNIGVDMDYRFDFEDTVFESCGTGVAANSYMVSHFQRCWWEANVNLDISFNTDRVSITDSYINSYTRQQFFSTGGGVDALNFNNVEFVTTNASPFIFGVSPSGNNIFNTAGSTPKTVNFNNCIFPINTVMGFIYNNRTVNKIEIQNMQQDTLMFTAAAVGASATPTMNGTSGFASYTMQEAGDFISINIFGSAVMTGGTYNIETRKNGVAIADLSFPTVPIQSALPFADRIQPLQASFVKGDVISVYFNTSAAFAPANNICYEVIVSYGPSGKQV